MEEVSEYLSNAEECLKMAQLQRDHAMHEQFLELARQWALLAAAREEFLRTHGQIIKHPN